MAPTTWIPNRYPAARRCDASKVYASEAKGKVEVKEPYLWLEENTEETEKWTTAQEKFTREYLDKNPDRERLENEIRKSTDYEKVSLRFDLADIAFSWYPGAQFSAPSLKRDGRWYWYYNSGLQNQSGAIGIPSSFCPSSLHIVREQSSIAPRTQSSHHFPHLIHRVPILAGKSSLTYVPRNDTPTTTWLITIPLVS